MGLFFEKLLRYFGKFLSWFQDHKTGLQVSCRGVGKRLIAQNAAEMNPLGVSVQLKEASGGHF